MRAGWAGWGWTGAGRMRDGWIEMSRMRVDWEELRWR